MRDATRLLIAADRLANRPCTDVERATANLLKLISDRLSERGFYPQAELNLALLLADAIEDEYRNPDPVATQPVWPGVDWSLYDVCTHLRCQAAAVDPCRMANGAVMGRPHLGRPVVPSPLPAAAEAADYYPEALRPAEATVHRYVSVSLSPDGWVGKCSCDVGGFGHDSKEEAHESLMAHLGADHTAGA